MLRDEKRKVRREIVYDGQHVETGTTLWDKRFHDEYSATEEGKKFRESLWPFDFASCLFLFPISIGRTFTAEQWMFFYRLRIVSDAETKVTLHASTGDPLSLLPPDSQRAESSRSDDQQNVWASGIQFDFRKDLGARVSRWYPVEGRWSQKGELVWQDFATVGEGLVIPTSCNLNEVSSAGSASCSVCIELVDYKFDSMLSDESFEIDYSKKFTRVHFRGRYEDSWIRRIFRKIGL